MFAARLVCRASRAVLCTPVRANGSTAAKVYRNGLHRSNAQELINKVPVIEVAGHVAVCDGGSGTLGHPIEYIELDTPCGTPQTCKYCGLRYTMKEGHHAH